MAVAWLQINSVDANPGGGTGNAWDSLTDPGNPSSAFLIGDFRDDTGIGAHMFGTDLGSYGIVYGHATVSGVGEGTEWRERFDYELASFGGVETSLWVDLYSNGNLLDSTLIAAVTGSIIDNVAVANFINLSLAQADVDAMQTCVRAEIAAEGDYAWCYHNNYPRSGGFVYPQLTYAAPGGCRLIDGGVLGGLVGGSLVAA